MRGTLVAGLLACLASIPNLARAQQTDAALVEKGRYLAVAGDCQACHTQPHGEGEPFAGGYGIQSPLGSIFSTNITPSKTAGIGNYTEAQFARALREGVRADGSNLYPAMPYTAYSLMPDEDVHALYTYLMTAVKPVDAPPPPTALPFPFNLRFSMTFWNALFLGDKPFQPDPSRSAEWNRGAYLVEGPAHCGACHTPRNLLMAERQDQAFGGAQLGSWYAPNITPDPVGGIGAWSDDEVVQYLRTGAVVGKAQAGGGMAEAIQHSLQYLTEDDLRAIAVYLRSLKPLQTAGLEAASFARGQPADFEAKLRGSYSETSHDSLQSGEALYSGYCASCHQSTGAGTRDQAYPSLFHNSATGGPNANNLVSAILFGVEREVGGKHVLMPRFDEQSFVGSLDDRQISLISNYVLQRFGNSSVQVTPADVAEFRRGGPPAPLARMAPYALPLAVAAGVVAVILLFLIAWAWRRRSQMS